MKIKITCPVKGYQAGLIYDMPDKQAQDLIDKECAVEYTDAVIEATSMGDENPVYIEGAKKKKVKHDNG